MKKTDMTQKIADACKKARIENNLRLQDVCNDLKDLGLNFGMTSIQRFETGTQAIPFEVAVYYAKIGAELDCFLK